MSEIVHREDQIVASRRTILGGFKRVTLSAGAIGLLAACRSSRGSIASEPAGDPSQDVGVLNIALGLEHQAVAAYQVGAESGLLEPGVLDVAVLFQGHHKGHRDALAGAITQLGGTPVEPKSMDSYAAALDVAGIGSQADILMLARRLEKEAANAYLGAIPVFGNSDLAKISGRLAADETMHWTILAQATGEPLPMAPLSFGA